jgi:hypothetical protein
MKTNLYTVTVPLFAKQLQNLGAILEKAEAHAAGNADEISRLLNDRLADDMFPLGKQIEISCDTAKNASARLSGKEAPKFPDGVFELPALKQRITDTLLFLGTVSEADFADAEARRITLPFFPDGSLSGEQYGIEFALPNFFFHMTTAYAILRKNGVPLGKTDYIGSLPFSTEAA